MKGNCAVKDARGKTFLKSEFQALLRFDKGEHWWDKLMRAAFNN